MKRFMPIANFVLIATVFLLPLVIGVLAQGQLGRVLDVEIGKAQNAKGQIRIAHQKHFDEKDFVGAIDSYKETIKHFPDSAEAVEAKFRIGNIYHWDKFEPELAIAEYEKVIANHSDTDYALDSLIRTGEVYARLKKYGKALEYFQQVIDKSPDSKYLSRAQLDMANTLHHNLGDNVRAKQLYEEIPKQHPNTESAAIAQVWITHIQQMSGQIGNDEAIEVYQQITSSSPYYHVRAVAQYMVGYSNYLKTDYQQAIVEFRKVLEDYPNEYYDHKALTHYFLGRLYELIGSRQLAAEAYTKGSTAYPKSTWRFWLDNRLARLSK